MGFLDGLMGNASEVDREQLQREFEPILAEGEQIDRAFKVIRDLFVFTNRRLIMVDKQGMTGKKAAYHSIPYRAITHFAVETAGHFDADAELKIWISGSSTPIEHEFKRGTDIVGVQKSLAQYVC
jgi:hypothetical protein